MWKNLLGLALLHVWLHSIFPLPPHTVMLFSISEISLFLNQTEQSPNHLFFCELFFNLKELQLSFFLPIFSNSHSTSLHSCMSRSSSYCPYFRQDAFVFILKHFIASPMKFFVHCIICIVS